MSSAQASPFGLGFFLILLTVVGVIAWVLVVSDAEPCPPGEFSFVGKGFQGDASLIMEPSVAAKNHVMIGRNDNYQLGMDVPSVAVQPLKIPMKFGDHAIQQIGFNRVFGMALDSNGDVWFWGGNSMNGDGNMFSSKEDFVRPKPRVMIKVNNDRLHRDGSNDIRYNIKFSMISLRSSQTFALLLSTQGRLFFIGRQDFNVGDTINTSSVPIISRLGFADPLPFFKYINTGIKYACAAISINGNLYTWGNTAYQRLGRSTDEVNSTNGVILDASSKISGIENCKMVAIGRYASVALTEDGKLYSWGSKNPGLLIAEGEEAAAEGGVPTPVDASGFIKGEAELGENETWSFVSLEDQLGVAITSEGRVFLWGENHVDESIKLIPSDDSDPVYQLTLLDDGLFGSTTWKEGYGIYKGFVLKDDENNVYTKGSNYKGQLGQDIDDDVNDQSALHDIAQVDDVKADVIGFSHFSAQWMPNDHYTLVCCVKNNSGGDPTVTGWGMNDQFKLTDEAFNLDQISRFVPVDLYADAVDVALSTRHSFWINKDNELWMSSNKNSENEGDTWANAMRGDDAEYDPTVGKKVDDSGTWSLVKAPYWKDTGDNWFVGVKDNEVYVWGAGGAFFNVIVGSDSETLDEPTKVSTSLFEGEVIKDLDVSHHFIAVLVESGKLFTTGPYNNGMRGHTPGTSGIVDFAMVDENIPSYAFHDTFTKVACGSSHMVAETRYTYMPASGFKIAISWGLSTTGQIREIACGDKWTAFVNRNDAVILLGSAAKDIYTFSVTNAPQVSMGSKSTYNIRNIFGKGRRVYFIDQNWYIYAFGDNKNGYLGVGSELEVVKNTTAVRGVYGKVRKIVVQRDNTIILMDED